MDEDEKEQLSSSDGASKKALKGAGKTGKVVRKRNYKIMAVHLAYCAAYSHYYFNHWVCIFFHHYAW